MALLEVTGLVKAFGGLNAVDGVDFQVEQGEIVGLIGPNGAGKTTFVDCLTGVELATAGRIIYAGHDISRLPAHQRNRLGLARTFQIPRPFGDMTVRDNVMVGAMFGRDERRYAPSQLEDLADRTMHAVGLSGLGQHRISSLTTGGRKRLEMARCLAAEPDLLFLDEPLGGLNRTEVKEALSLIQELRASGVTIVFIEHIVPAVMAVSDRIVVLANGRKLAEGMPSEVQSNAEVRLAYLGDVKNAISRYRGHRNVSRRQAHTDAWSA